MKKKKAKPIAEEVDDLVEIDVPKGVVDPVAFKHYKALQRHPYLNDKRLIHLSDGQALVLGMMVFHLKNKIAHLPLPEQVTILDEKTRYQKVMSQMAAYKRKAYGGLNKDAHGERFSSVILYYKDEVIDMFGRFFSMAETSKHLAEKHGIEIPPHVLKKFYDANDKEIKLKQENFQQNYTDVRLFVKRSRLEELLWLYTSRKEKYLQSQHREDYKLLLVTLEALRKESEGEVLNINGSLQVQIEQDIRVHLRKEIFKEIGLREIIIGRVAARQGISSERMIASLNNSYYNKLANAEEVDDVEYTKFPSSETYDFNLIEKINKNKKPESKAIVVLKDKAQSVKEQFLAKIQANRAKMEGKGK